MDTLKKEEKTQPNIQLVRTTLLCCHKMTTPSLMASPLGLSVQEFFNLKEKSESIDTRLHIGCDNLLKQIFQEHLENGLIESESELIKYIPYYTTNTKFMGLFFSVDFNLVELVGLNESVGSDNPDNQDKPDNNVSLGLGSLDFDLAHINNSNKEKLKKMKKKIIIESDRVKQIFPQMYTQVKNKFLSQVSKLEELVERADLSKKIDTLKNNIRTTCVTRDQWATLLYQWYWVNKLGRVVKV